MLPDHVEQLPAWEEHLVIDLDTSESSARWTWTSHGAVPTEKLDGEGFWPIQLAERAAKVLDPDARVVADLDAISRTP